MGVWSNDDHHRCQNREYARQTRDDYPFSIWTCAWADVLHPSRNGALLPFSRQTEHPYLVCVFPAHRALPGFAAANGGNSNTQPVLCLYTEKGSAAHRRATWESIGMSPWEQGKI